jgi:hypothetical protein
VGVVVGLSYRGRDVGYGCLRENKVLMKIFGPKRDEGTGGWSRLIPRDCIIGISH